MICTPIFSKSTGNFANPSYQALKYETLYKQQGICFKIISIRKEYLKIYNYVQTNDYHYYDNSVACNFSILGIMVFFTGQLLIMILFLPVGFLFKALPR